MPPPPDPAPPCSPASSTAVATPGQALAATTTSELDVDEALLTYLTENQGDAKYLVAVQTSTESVPIILATGRPVVTIGGYKSRDPYPSADQLAALVASGEAAVRVPDRRGHVELLAKAPTRRRPPCRARSTGCWRTARLSRLRSTAARPREPSTSRSLYRPPRKLAEQRHYP